MGYFEDCWNTAPAGELLQYSFFFRGGFAAFGIDFFNEPDCGEIGFDLANLASRSEVVSSFDYMVFVRGVFCDFAFSTFFNVAMISRIIFSLMGICSGSSGQ